MPRPTTGRTTRQAQPPVERRPTHRAGVFQRNAAPGGTGHGTLGHPVRIRRNPRLGRGTGVPGSLHAARAATPPPAQRAAEIRCPPRLFLLCSCLGLLQRPAAPFTAASASRPPPALPRPRARWRAGKPVGCPPRRPRLFVRSLHAALTAGATPCAPFVRSAHGRPFVGFVRRLRPARHLSESYAPPSRHPAPGPGPPAPSAPAICPKRAAPTTSPRPAPPCCVAQ